jgi:hydrogenase maturation protease
MDDVSSSLAEVIRGRTAFVGIGNTDRGDDGLGVRLAESLREAGVEDVVIAGTTPENHVTGLAKRHYDTVVFFDAIGAGSSPGSVILLDAAEMRAKFPQVSTHNLSLGTLARLVQSESETRVWLLGVQPVSTDMGTRLSGVVEKSLAALTRLITQAKRASERFPDSDDPHPESWTRRPPLRAEAQITNHFTASEPI